MCATCHSLNRIAFRNMDGVCYTTAEIKDMAAEVRCQNRLLLRAVQSTKEGRPPCLSPPRASHGADPDPCDRPCLGAQIEYEEPPDEEGNVETRPGKPFDYMPAPYASEAAARSANAGALPPDLSLIVKARHNGANYVFSLMTGFVDPPVNVELAPGQHYNPYFPGGKIAMARPLQDGQVEYDDGTEASTSQMAKDVTVFLNWAAEPEHDDRKKMGVKWMIALTFMAMGSGYLKRFRWSLIKGRRLEFK